MSTVKANNVQVGQSGTATNNFTLYQPSTPDGTVRLAVGNSGATTGDVLSVSSTGLSVTGTLTSTGVNTFPAGSASAPSITTTGDTNTGVFFPAADTAAISTGGTERLRVDSNGRLFVGDTSVIEDAKFEVVGAKFYTVGIPRAQIAAVDSTAIATGVGGAINFVGKYTGSTYTSFGSVEGYKENATDGNYAGSLVFKTRTNGGNQNEQMRIDSSGNLLVGTTSAVTGSKLVVDTGDATIYGVRVGRGAGSVSTNTAVGASALATNSTGSFNTAVGWQALLDNTTASGSTAVGYRSLENSTASANTAVGDRALVSNTSGANNTAVGTQALTENTTASNNTAIGYQALYANTTGADNTAVGFQAGDVITTGTGNVIIGKNADPSANSGTDQIVIGNGVTGQANTNVTIGNATGKIYNAYTVNATWTQTSDGTMKNVIGPDSLGLSFINRLNPILFTWKAQNDLPPDHPYYAEENKRDTTRVIHGFVAQEVKAALDAEGCSTFNGWDQGDDGIQAISREMFISPLVKAVQELSAQVEQLKAELAALKGN